MSSVSMPPSSFIESPNGRIHYHEMGEGPPVVLIHGGGAGAFAYSNYRKNIGPLSQHNRVIIFDMPGFGKSAPRAAPAGLFKSMAGALGEVLDHLKIEKASLVGNSLGGATSLRFTLDHPDRVDRLILMGTAGSLPVHTVTPSEGSFRLLGFYRGEGPTMAKLKALLEVLIYDTSGITEELLAERFKSAVEPSVVANPPLHLFKPNDRLWTEPLDQLQHKTLLIWGREDRIVPLDAAYILQKQMPNADLVVFSKCGHWAQWEKADAFNRLVADFLHN
ncbi:alpha/beta fold hydrolase [Bradyrhizobium sp. AUGA SZCCT0240]|uniref:alpha/beta fold hydrolase n=1 Tax=Bradyrhizobium sp. AUGA SZCCT0240 TaxID=2807669 RepID=UPI001BA73740|nr:alpha/beta fold hydrolase [Bradyrhizobium sp. AUGA SZCCT0240]MBR1252287.1 alpha/beta fold hydrolase [Bradyrhizobium sp. AUGA SZCCT0240]